MKNYQKYAEKIKEYEGPSFCDEFIKPHILNISDCSRVHCSACRMLQTIWLLEDYKEPETDWSKIKVDTPILVRDTEDDCWYKAYFAKYKGGTVYAWSDGRTSWTSKESWSWKYAKLAESEKGGAE